MEEKKKPEAKKKPAGNSDAEKRKSLLRVLKYAKREWFSFTVGNCYLILGAVSDLVVPLYIGWVITALETSNFEVIGPLCW